MTKQDFADNDGSLPRQRDAHPPCCTRHAARSAPLPETGDTPGDASAQGGLGRSLFLVAGRPPRRPAASRDVKLSLPRMWATCPSAVRRASTSRSAISRSVRPSATSSAISLSRRVSRTSSPRPRPRESAYVARAASATASSKRSVAPSSRARPKAASPSASRVRARQRSWSSCRWPKRLAPIESSAACTAPRSRAASAARPASDSAHATTSTDIAMPIRSPKGSLSRSTSRAYVRARAPCPSCHWTRASTQRAMAAHQRSEAASLSAMHSSAYAIARSGSPRVACTVASWTRASGTPNGSVPSRCSASASSSSGSAAAGSPQKAEASANPCRACARQVASPAAVAAASASSSSGLPTSICPCRTASRPATSRPAARATLRSTGSSACGAGSWASSRSTHARPSPKRPTMTQWCCSAAAIRRPSTASAGSCASRSSAARRLSWSARSRVNQSTWAGPNSSPAAVTARPAYHRRCRSAYGAAPPVSASRASPYSRSDSSMWKRAAPPIATGSRTSTDLATSPSTTSASAAPGRSSSQATASRAARSNPPLNTDARAHASRSRGSSRSWLQSSSAWRVCCRGSAARFPRVSSAKRSLSRSRICCTVSDRARTEASSIASGIPSSRRTSSASASWLAAVSRNDDQLAVARSTKSRTAS